MKKGTQAMLDAAKDDATLLPYGVKFKTNGKKPGHADAAPVGVVVIRAMEGGNDNRESVAFDTEDGTDWWYCSAATLEPIKKEKKWQNGTQAQLDAAKDDARLIPKKAYFKSKYGKTVGKIVYVIDNKHNERANVLMFASTDFSADFHNASDLEPIND